MEERGHGKFPDYEALYDWSVREPDRFWGDLVEFLGVISDGSLSPIFQASEIDVPLARAWFPNLRLNFCENLLRKMGPEPAIVSWSESQIRRVFSWDDLHQHVAGLRKALISFGIEPGDKLFGYLPNIPEAIAAMLAASSLGATWSSCGTEFQFDGLISRIKRVRPKVLIACASYLWRGEEIRVDSLIEELIRAAPSIEYVILVDYLGGGARAGAIAESRDFVFDYRQIVSSPPTLPISFKRFPFSHPLYIMFSSGTTGEPKAIIHSAGGTLLEHMKEMTLHSDVRAGDVVQYQTSTSWMMWNWLASGLGCQATLALYDGDPMREDGNIMWRMADEERVTHFGTSAAYLNAVEKRGVKPNSRFNLNSLRAVLSTGSTLFPRQFDYVLMNIKRLWIQSISGGTDILGCFALGCPLKPVIRGAIQCKSLGYDVRVYDSGGKSVIDQEGELVCVAPAPSMPIKFLDDDNGTLYRSAYYDQYPSVWRHGDVVEERGDGALFFRGRSDATLKPGGVRIATSDIYSALSAIPALEESMVVGYTPPNEAIELLILFVVLRGGCQLNSVIESTIVDRLGRANRFYVPALVLQAPELPRTANNKLAEIPVKRILAGKEPGNRAALSNPASLDFFENQARAVIVMKLG
jgi:acetoacetyl-CoA synthetase